VAAPLPADMAAAGARAALRLAPAAHALLRAPAVAGVSGVPGAHSGTPTEAFVRAAVAALDLPSLTQPTAPGAAPVAAAAATSLAAPAAAAAATSLAAAAPVEATPVAEARDTSGPPPSRCGVLGGCAGRRMRCPERRQRPCR
jgi:hypothetical protein